MDMTRKLELMCAVIGNVGTDDREATRTIRNPTPALFSTKFPATFPKIAVYMEWIGTGRWEVEIRILESAPGFPEIHRDSRIVLDFTKGTAVQLVLDWSEVVFPRPGHYALMLFEKGTENSEYARGFSVVKGDGPVRKTPSLDPEFH